MAISTTRSEWNSIELKEVIQETQPGFACGERDQDGVVQLRMNNVDTRGRLSLEEFIRVPAENKTISRFRLIPGDVLFNNTNSTKLVGKSAVFRGHAEPVVYSNHFTRLRTKATMLDAEFLSFWLQLQWRMGTFERLCNRWIGQSAVKADKLLELKIPLPPVPEQKRIVAKLNEQMAAVERAKVAMKVQLDATDRMVAACLRDAFKSIAPLAVNGRRDDPPKGWTWQKLTDIARLESGHTPSRNHPEWWGGDVPWLALADIRALDGGIVIDTAEHTNEAGLANSSARLLPKGTVALSRTASVGFVTIMGRPMATSQDFVNWVCGPKVIPEFLAYLLQVSRARLRDLASGAIHKTIYMNTVEEFQVCVPSEREQRVLIGRLSRQLEAAHQTRAVVRQNLTALEHMPVVLFAQAFTGGV